MRCSRSGPASVTPPAPNGKDSALWGRLEDPEDGADPKAVIANADQALYFAKHHGRIFKLMGDGLLAEFGSVVDAVECAVALQRGLAERNASVPENERIDVRIGINLGEVIVDGEDRYGEGVNIAARLQALAAPGGI